MTSTDDISIPAALSVEDQANTPEPKPRAHSLSIAQLKALVRHTNPCSHNDDRDLVLRALHHETKASGAGLAIADDWSSHANDYPGFDEVAKKWHSLKDHTGDPVTVGTLCDMVEANGFDWIDICSSPDPDFNTCSYVIVDPDEQQAVTTPAPSTPFDKYSLKGLRSNLLQDAVKQAFALEPLALMGQATVLFSPPNTGKTLITLHLIADAVSRGNIDPTKLFYCNADDSHAGLLEKLKYADEYGYHTIAEGHQGFSTGQFLKILDDLIANNQAHGVIIILDTGKKFFDPMSKRQGRAFGKHVRLFIMKGGTIIVLSHTNKYRDNEGKPIYAGTSDIVEDFDCAYIMYEACIDADTETKTILIENIKNRGIVARQASYRYSIADNLSYRELLDSVQPVDDTKLSSLKQAVEIEAEAKVIDAITLCIHDGMDIKMQLADSAAKQSGVSKRAALRILDKFCGSDPDKHRWNFQVHERGAKKYYLLCPITAGNDPVS